MQKNRLLILSCIFMLVFTVQAQNLPTDLGPASDFNVFVLDRGEFNSSDVEGRVAVGGNAYINSFDIGDKLTTTGDVLIVGDTLRYNTGNVYNGNVIYGSAEITSGLGIPQGTMSQGNPLDFLSTNMILGDISRQWKLIPSNGTVTFNNNELNLSGNDPDLNVFFVEGDDLTAANNFLINVPSGSSVLVNIEGDSLSWSGGLQVNGTNKTRVVYNFHSAFHINLSNIGVHGSILAPYAHLNFTSGLVEGTVVAYSTAGAGQYNLSLFQGTIEYIPSEINSDCEVTIKQTYNGQNITLNPGYNGTTRFWAGTFLGYVNNHSAQFYCVDINHNLQFNADYTLDVIINGPIKYIVSNYYPGIDYTGTNGQLNNVKKEAAAVQAAIWYFSDGFTHENITNAAIRDRAIEIVNDATGKNPPTLSTFEIIPKSQLVQSDAAAEFKVVARDADGNPVQGVSMDIETTEGTLSSETGVTDAAGEFRFTLLGNGAEQAQVTVSTYDAIIPGGTRYIRPNKQTLVTNASTVTCLKTAGVVTWTDEPLPGNTLTFYTYNYENSEIPAEFVTGVDAAEGVVVASTQGNGVIVYNPEEDAWETHTMATDGFPTDATTCVHLVDFNGYEGDAAVGMVNEGFLYHVEASDQILIFDETNGFAAVTVNDIEEFEYNGEEYLAIAHSSGVSFMKLSDRSFVNITMGTNDFPASMANAVAVDGDSHIWAATNSGLAVSDDLGSTWTVYDTTGSNILSNIVTSVAADDNKIYVGFYNQGLAVLNKDNGVWGVMTQFISTNPVDDLLFADGKLYIANYNRGLYVYDGDKFEQYYTLSSIPVTQIVEAIAFDGEDLWAGTRTGLAKTMHGTSPEFGDAAVVLDDKKIHVGGTTTMAVRLMPEGDLNLSVLTGTIIYNTNELQLVGGTPGALLANWKFHELGNQQDGMLRFRLQGGDPITEEGVLFYLTFKVKDSVPSAGQSVVYVTEFDADLDTPLEHTDLGIIYYSMSDMGNAGRGDANLDDAIDITDLHTIINHLNYGGEYELTGDALANADVNQDTEVDYDDVSDMMYYLFNGLFPPVPVGPTAPEGSFDSGTLTFNEGDKEVTIPVVVSPFSSPAKANALLTEKRFRNMAVTFTYDAEKIEFETFSSALLATGNFVNATELEEGKARFTFASPFKMEAEGVLGELVLKFKGDEIPYGTTISTTYQVDGSAEMAGPDIVLEQTSVEDEQQLPVSFKLYNNYPNPFNPTTNIRFDIPQAARVSIRVFDILGQQVTELVNKEVKPGSHIVTWNAVTNSGARAVSGVYLYRIEAENLDGSGRFVQTQKMILLK